MPVKVKFTANRAGIAEIGRSEGVYRDLERRGDRVIEAARTAAAGHHVSGDYDASFRKARTLNKGRAAVLVFNFSDHADILERGSRPHVIEAKGVDGGGKKALYWRGADHPVRRVNHPGTPAYHFLRNALQAARG